MKTRIPNTDSIRELADFWDTHDLTDFEEELQEMGEPVFQQKPAMTIALSPQEAEAVDKLATSEGLEPSELVRRWVHEKVTAS